MICFNSKKAGYVKKTHGTKGELVITLDYFITDDFYLEKWVFLKHEGMLIPFSIEHYKIIDHQSLIIEFSQINNIDDAKKFIDSEFFVEKTLKWLKKAEKRNVVGFSIFDNHHHLLGIITEIIPIKNNPIVQVENEKQKFLVPFNDQIISDIDHKNRQVFLKLSKNELIA